MKLLRVQLISVVVLSILAFAACAHRSSNGKTVPVSPWEQVVTDNDLLANANNFVSKTVINAQAAFPDKISTNQAAAILVQQRRIAAVDQQLTAVLKLGPTATNLAQVQGFISEIQDAVNQLNASGGLGIKNPDTQMTVKSYVDSIGSLAQAVLSGVKAYYAGLPASSGMLIDESPSYSGTEPIALLIAQLVSLILSTTPLAIAEIQKIKALLAANPDVEANLRALFADTDDVNADTISTVDTWLASHGLGPDGKPLSIN